MKKADTRTATLLEIAREAGVSRSAVGHILNGNAAKLRIASSTAERVERIARSHGYLPNFAVRQLRSGKTYHVAFIVASAHPAKSGLSAFAVSMIANLQTLNYQTTIIFVEMHSSKISPLFAERRFDGMVIDGIVPNWKYLEEWGAGHGIPCVFLNHESAASNCAGIDEAGTARLVVDTLQKAGFRKIAYYFPRDLDSNPLFPDDFIFERERCVRMELEGRGLPLYPDTVEQRRHGENTAAYLMSLAPRPDCVIAYDAFHGVEFKRCLNDMNLSVPSDVGLVVYESNKFNRAARIAGVDFDFDATGHDIAEMILARIDGAGDLENRKISGRMVTEYDSIHLDSLDHFKHLKLGSQFEFNIRGA